MKRRILVLLAAGAVALGITGCVASPSARASATASSGPTATAAAQPDDYQRLGLSPSAIAPWEDGMRTTGAPGSYEWWYFDFTLTDGSTMVIAFYTKSITRPETPLAPYLTFELDNPDGTAIRRTLQADPADFSASKDRCEVHVGESSVSGDLHDYTVHVAIKDVAVDARLHGTVPPWRPGTGYMDFGSHYFAWLPSVPQGTIDGTLTIAGSSRALTGIGYHDHNWGDASMLGLIHDWYWGRAQVGPYTVIASYITASDAYGRATVPIFMLARDGQIIADDASKVRFTADQVHTDSVTGKPVADLLVYDYDTGASRYRVSFQRETDLLRTRLADLLPGFQRFLARLAGFDGAYLRFTGPATIERYDGDSVAESVNQRAAVWELMYFGHAPEGRQVASGE